MTLPPATAARSTVTLDGRSLSPRHVVDVALGGAPVRISGAARERNQAAQRLVSGLVDRGELLYGVTTGVGMLRTSPVDPLDQPEQQRRLLRSHAGGGGAPLAVEVVRSAMTVRANQLGAGGAGVSESLYDNLLAALALGLTPFTRELGSLGTGDLTVLADIALALVGEGRVWRDGELVDAATALGDAGLQPATLGPRDGIAFMSSNAAAIGQAAIVCVDAQRLLHSAITVAALSFEATGADLAVLDPRVHLARPHPGQGEVAAQLRELLGDWGMRERSPRAGDPGVHDSFVFRCVPQVEGVLLDALHHLEQVLAVELNVAGENALLLPRDGIALPNGNFHAGILTLALDTLRGAMAQSASLVAARVSALLDPAVTGLPAQLAAHPGPDSGAMIVEYTAHAAAAEVRSLAAPTASQTTSVQGGIESHANFAGHASRRTADAVSRMAVAVSAELVLAVRALRLRGVEPRGLGTRAFFEAACAVLDADMRDRPLADDLEAARRLLFEESA
jgi:histidine ammonia-lyase